MDSLDLLKFPSEKDQNGDSHHMRELKISGKEFLSLPVRTKKYREHQSSSERKSQGSSASPLDAGEVRVQVPQSVGRWFLSPVLIWEFLVFVFTSFPAWCGGGSGAFGLENRVCL